MATRSKDVVGSKPKSTGSSASAAAVDTTSAAAAASAVTVTTTTTTTTANTSGAAATATTTKTTTATTAPASASSLSLASSSSSSSTTTAAASTAVPAATSSLSVAGGGSSAKTSRASDRARTTTAATATATSATSASTATTGLNGSSTATSTTPSTGSSSSSATTSVLSTATSTATAKLSTAPATSTASSHTTKSVPSALAKQTSSSSSVENGPPATQVDFSQCALCGGDGSPSPDEMMVCLCCHGAFHSRCANLPQTPEEGDTFCRWECFSTYRKSQGVPPKTPLGDFAKLAARVQAKLGDDGRHSGGPLAQVHPPMRSAAASSMRGKDPQPRPRERSKRTSGQGTNGRSRSPSPYVPHDGSDRSLPPGAPLHNDYGVERRGADDMGTRRPAARGRSPVQPRNHSPHIDLTMDDSEPPLPRSPRSRPPRGVGGRPPTEDLPFDDPEPLRSKRPKYLPHDDAMLNGGRGGGNTASRRDAYLQPLPPSRRMPSPSDNSSGAYANEFPLHYNGSDGVPSSMEKLKGGNPSRHGFPSGSYEHRGLPLDSSGRGPTAMPTRGPVPSRGLPPGDDELPSSRPSSGRSARSGGGGARYSDRMDEYNDGRGPAPGPPRSRPPSADHPVDGSSSSSSRRGRGPVDGAPANRHVQAATPPGRFNIPWLNPAAFPAGLRERFDCRPDNANGVFRIDLTPVFGDKTTHLYQSEIDFFFRCFESADVSLVIKGMASELNQYIWAWPFILESCGSETHFSFDHFQFRHNAGELPELEYVGELRLSMAAYNAYLERYLSGSMANDVIVLEDHATKKPVTIVAGENIIALNNLVIAEHCAQLHNDLIKSFQWDVFAGGIHCLLQYLPQANRHKRFASPLLHFNFPGARGRLRDPGNGTTDTAYQVLTGSLELVVFERLEPKDRDTFLRVLHAAGYDASKKTMLLDSHLRILRDSGFAWSTVLLNDGEFVHVNKGRLHFWRVVEPESSRGSMANSPCVFLSWEWVYQGVSQRGISTECWFAMKNASLCTGGWAFDPRRAIVEAAKCGVAIVRTGQFLNSLSGPGAPPVLMQLAFTGASPASIDRDVVSQRQEQMVLFLESILPCMDAIVEEEFELGLVKDDSDDFRKIFDDEIMWKVVDTALNARAAVRDADYDCGICGLELSNIYKQCLGCTVHARRKRPNAAYPVFRICLRCHAQPERHHFKPRALHGYYEKLCSSEGHTGLLPATRRYQAERSYFKCRCAPYVRCADCGGCESCCCLCHTLFQTRFRFTAPEHLDHLRTDVVDVIKWHKQQLQLLQQAAPPHLQRPHPHAQR